MITSIDTAMAYRACNGSLADLRVGPKGAVFAAEMLKMDERNAKDKNYVPNWNPGQRT